MQTIDHQIQVEITVVMQIVGPQQYTCGHHAASPHMAITLVITMSSKKHTHYITCISVREYTKVFRMFLLIRFEITILNNAIVVGARLKHVHTA